MAEYGALSRILHRLSLGNSFVGEICFDVESGIYRNDIPSSINGRHVFVSGLARAGTTVLMRAIHETDQFASLTYRDMPFVLAPNLWSRIVGHTKTEMRKAERAHGDGVLVDFDSPEALEEVFWKTFAGKEYLKEDRLLPHTVESDLIEKFRDYVSLIMMHYGKSRYLSKNNNNILRLNSILHAFPLATVLVPFREPMQHAYSLLRQHRRFAKENEKDPFSQAYMGWLAHHEFGGGHRPFKWPDQPAKAYKIESIDYWLWQWISTYSALLQNYENPLNQSEQLLFVCYESICSDTERVWGALSHKLDIVSSNIPDFKAQTAEVPAANDPGLEKSARELYEKLASYSRSGLD